MDPLHTALPSDLRFWPYDPTREEDNTAVWSETAGHVQSPPEFGLGGPITDMGWDLAALLQNPPQGVAHLTDLEVPNAIAFNPAFGYPNSSPDDLSHFNLDFPDPWLMPTPTLTDGPGSSTASSPSDAASLAWPLHSQFPISMVAAPQEAPVPGGPLTHLTTSPDQLAWIFDPGQFGIAPPLCTPVDRRGLGEVVPYSTANFVDFNGPPVEPMFPAGWVLGGPRLPTLSAAPGSVPDVAALPQTILGKRQRGEGDTLHGQKTSDGHQPSLRKKCKTTMATRTGILGAGGAGSITLQMPTTRTHSSINQKSKALGRGAERLATLMVQEVSDRSPHGPSVQQGLTGAIVQEQMPWLEGSAEGVAGYPIDSTQEAESGTRFYIPRGLDTRHRALLDATSDDWARGTVRVLKCRLCPGAGFSNWEIFRRHCSAMEAHPDNISFCKHCGDFFARSDSLTRHYNNRPQECRNVSPATAEMKRQETERVHAECEERLERCLKTKEDIGKPFAQIIKAMYPDSSKRGSRQQNRLKEPRLRR